MIPYARHSRLLTLPVVLFLLSVSCQIAPGADAPGSLSILTWNLQNLFDVTPDGGEYTEFTGPSWTWEAYRQRLSGFGGFLSALPACEGGAGKWPDIMVFQELENARVLEDLVAVIKDTSRSGFPFAWHAACPKVEGTGVTFGILARQAPILQRAHRVWVDGQTSRMVWELHFASTMAGVAAGASPSPQSCGRVVLFANHWKSKSGDEFSSETLRIAAAELVRQRTRQLQSDGIPTLFICAGDLNTQGLPGEAGGGTQALLPAQTPDEDAQASDLEPDAVLWLVPPGTRGGSLGAGASGGLDDSCRLWEEPWYGIPEHQGGSYFYDNAWERIDHILFRPCPGWGLSDFGVPDLPGLRSEEGLPRRYQTGTRKGVSDHLPLLARFETLPAVLSGPLPDGPVPAGAD